MVRDEGGSASAEATGMPRWVKAFLIAAVAVVVVVVLAALLAGGQHGPGRHRGTGPAYGAGQTLAGPGPADTGAGW